jgi:hypothetical protein
LRISCHMIEAISLPSRWTTRAIASIAGTLATTLAPATVWAPPQGPLLQRSLTEITWAEALTRQALAQYVWQEEETITVRGELKLRKTFRVKLGPDGELSRAAITPQDFDGQNSYALIKRMFRVNPTEYLADAKQITTLAQGYAYLSPSTLEDLTERGQITLGSAPFAGEVQLVVQSYLKPGDSLTILFSHTRKALVSIQASSYLLEPQDELLISAQYEQLTNGPNHVSSVLVSRARRQMTLALRNSGYQKDVSLRAIR